MWVLLVIAFTGSGATSFVYPSFQTQSVCVAAGESLKKASAPQAKNLAVIYSCTRNYK